MSARYVLNLTFHGIGEPPGTLDADEVPYWAGEEAFTHILDLAARRPDVRLSFDDGNDSDVEIALPALRARGLRATFFVLVGRLDERGSLSREGVRELARAGMTIGSHGLHHRSWPDLDAHALDEELCGSRAILGEVLGRAPTDASCPFGRYDRSVLSAVRRAGYARAFTSDGGRARPGMRLQPRTSVRRSDGPGDLVAGATGGRALLRQELRMWRRRWR